MSLNSIFDIRIFDSGTRYFLLAKDMITEIGEPIKAGVVFGADCIGGKKIKPVWFIWKERQYRIKEVTYTWTGKDGSASVHYFSVTDGQDLYEIAYNAETMVWTLMAVEVDG